LKRRFFDVGSLQLHAWIGGSGDALPLVMLHAAPGSARMLLPLAERIAQSRPVLAIDLPGMGDSTPGTEPLIDNSAAAIAAALAATGIGACAIYGTLSGARVAVELALRHPARALILDGVGVADPAQAAALAQRYVPSFEIDWMGSQFHQVWHLVRDQYLFYPWYARDAAHRRSIDLPAPELLHIKAMEVLKALNHAGSLLRAALAYPLLDKLADLKLPMLASADLAGVLPTAQPMAAAGGEPLTASDENLAARCSEFEAFLRSVPA
jgi:pimeloyl-ACP methyl ester carboxylesterase